MGFDDLNTVMALWQPECGHIGLVMSCNICFLVGKWDEVSGLWTGGPTSWPAKESFRGFITGERAREPLDNEFWFLKQYLLALNTLSAFCRAQEKQ